jgi:hypothetical protein
VLGTAVTLTLHLDRTQKRLTVGWNGGVQTVPMHADGDAWTVDGTFNLGRYCGPVGFDKPSVLAPEHFTLRSTGSGVEVTAAGKAEGQSGDQLQFQPFAVTFTGGVDSTGPGLISCLTIPALLDTFVSPGLIFDEPLPAAALVRLVPDVGPPVTLATQTTAGSSYDSKRALAFGRHYQFDVQPYVDLGNNPGTAARLPAFATPVLGLAVADGFEGRPEALLRGGAVVGDPSSPPPLVGQRSLYLPKGGSYTARLPVHAGDQVVRFTARAVTVDGESTPADRQGYVQVETAAPDGLVATAQLTAGTGPYAVDPSDATRQLGAPVEVSLPLPADVGDEIMIRLANPDYPTFWPPDLQIDELRVE